MDEVQWIHVRRELIRPKDELDVFLCTKGKYELPGKYWTGGWESLVVVQAIRRTVRLHEWLQTPHTSH